MDLSDDGTRLILSQVTEYKLTEDHQEVIVAHHPRLLIPVTEVHIVEVKDRSLAQVRPTQPGKQTVSRFWRFLKTRWR